MQCFTPWDDKAPESLAMPAGGSEGFVTGGLIRSIVPDSIEHFLSKIS
jgi:hypothetical protein